MSNKMEIPPGLREQVLAQIRAEVGDSTYNGLIESLGENGVLNTYIDMLTAMQSASPQSSSPGARLRNIRWMNLVGYLLIVGISAGLAQWHGDGAISGILAAGIAIYLGRAAVLAMGATKLGSTIFGFLGVAVAAICAIAGVIFIFIPSLRWWYVAVAFFVAVVLFVIFGKMLAEGSLQCEQCGSKNTEIIERYVGGPAYADKAKLTARVCKQCGHTQHPFF